MILPLLLALAPSPAAAPSPAPAPSGPPPAFAAAAQAFEQCLGRVASALPASVTPDEGAKQVVAGCTAERATVDQQFESWVGSPGFPADKRATARAQYGQRMGAVTAQISSALAQRVPAPTPGAAPSGGR